MYRLVNELNAKGESEPKAYGVLTDYDLSSWRKDLENDYTRTSQQRTGTPPYMAYELLQGRSATHLYRHDLESLFYIMLLTVAHHTIAPAKSGPSAREEFVMRDGTLLYRGWFKTLNYTTLGSVKKDFLSSPFVLDLSPVFEDFRSWLADLHSDFLKGFNSKNYYDSVSMGQGSNWRQEREWSTSGVVPTSVPFDDGTLGGRVDYSTIIEPTRYLKGKLQGLIIRYDPTSPPLPTRTGAAQANA